MSKLRILVGLLAVLGLFAGCKEDDPPTYGNVWVMHAILDGPTVNVQVDGTTVESGLTYPNATDAYTQVEAGSRNVSVLDGTTELASTTVNVGTDKNHSVFAYRSNAGTHVLTAVEDDLTAPASGKAHLRVVHLFRNVGSVDVGMVDGTSVTALSGLTGISYGNASAFRAFDAATFDLAVVGTTASTTVGAIAILQDQRLTAGKIYTLVIHGDLTVTGSNAYTLFENN